MSEIETLEDRISKLEKRIHGLSIPDIDEPLPETTIIDNLLHVNTLVSSALSSREKTNAFAKKLDQLNELLDSNYEEDDLQIETKLTIILAMEEEIRKNLNLLMKVQELLPVLEVDKIKDVPELLPRMERLNVGILKNFDESNQLNSNIYQLFNKYNNIITTISQTFVGLDAIVTAAENARIPKKQQD